MVGDPLPAARGGCCSRATAGLRQDVTILGGESVSGPSVTTWGWAQLPSGAYDLPGPAVVASEWVLEARERHPDLAGFTRVTAPERWPQVGTARGVIADYPNPDDVMVIGADRPAEVDADGLRHVVLGSWAAGGVRWVTGGMFAGPAAQTFHDRVHEAGRVLLLTGDLRTWWAATHTAETLSFDQLFPGGTWAAWVPLLTHLYDTGVGTRPLSART